MTINYTKSILKKVSEILNSRCNNEMLSKRPTNNSETWLEILSVSMISQINMVGYANIPPQFLKEKILECVIKPENIGQFS